MKTVRDFAQRYNCEYEIARCLTYYPEKAQKLWETKVEFSNHMKSAGGYARPSGITLHSLLPQTFEGVRPTLLHEVAHIIQWLVYGEFNHKYTFHEVMHRLGEVPSRCHNMLLRELSRLEAKKKVSLVKPKLDDLEF